MRSEYIVLVGLATPLLADISCGVSHGYDRGDAAYYYSGDGSLSNFDACSAKCQSDSKCQSFAFGDAQCLLYSAPLDTNFRAQDNSPFLFYDRDCMEVKATSSFPTILPSTAASEATATKEATTAGGAEATPTTTATSTEDGSGSGSGGSGTGNSSGATTTGEDGVTAVAVNTAAAVASSTSDESGTAATGTASSGFATVTASGTAKGDGSASSSGTATKSSGASGTSTSTSTSTASLQSGTSTSAGAPGVTFSSLWLGGSALCCVLAALI